MKDETLTSKDTFESFETATGKIQYTLLNDYMFHYLFQEDKESLKMLCCALLGYDESWITDIKVENPIIPGKSFDKIAKGNDYRHLKSATHIGIVDFSLQEYGLSPEFYARYRLMNVKNHEIYNSNFNLNVLPLNHIDLATKDDCRQELNHWAAMFKAKTWEDLKVIAEKSEVFTNIAKDLYNGNSDWLVQEECRRREERLAHEKYVKEHMEELEQANAELTQTNLEMCQHLEEKNRQMAEQSQKILELEREIQELKENK